MNNWDKQNCACMLLVGVTWNHLAILSDGKFCAINWSSKLWFPYHYPFSGFRRKRNKHSIHMSITWASHIPDTVLIQKAILHPINQSINQAINQAINRSIDQSINQSINQSLENSTIMTPRLRAPSMESKFTFWARFPKLTHLSVLSVFQPVRVGWRINNVDKAANTGGNGSNADQAHLIEPEAINTLVPVFWWYLKSQEHETRILH